MAKSKAKKAPKTNPEAEWFGFNHVSPEEKTDRVRGVFDSVANKYDLMNDLMSAGLHRLWKNYFVNTMNPQAGQVVLDVAGGTGDIALRCAEKTRGAARITVCDINPSMLAVGRGKAIDRGWLPGQIEWIVGNAEKLPVKSKSVDLACIVFGLRNVTRIDAALKEFARVLKPGGKFYCMEFSPGVRPELKSLYDIYSFNVLPWLGKMVAEDEDSYQYLAESIRQFPDQQTLAKRMESAGFSDVEWEDLMGGVVAVHSGVKTP